MVIHDKPACGIVTYNPEIELLKRNIEAIKGQVSHVYLYDNGSSNLDTIMELANTYGTEVAVIDGFKNRGLAVALNVLARRVAEDGAGAILFLDQDSIAPSQLVATLFEYLSDGVGIVAPMWKDRNTGVEVVKDEEPLQASSVITSGSLVSLSAYAMTGGYDERLFVDFVDYDFSIAMRQAGYKILKLPFIALEHSVGHAEKLRIPIPTSIGRNGISWKRYRYNHPVFRRLDMARSSTIICHKYRGSDYSGEVNLRMLESIVGIFLSERHKFRTLKLYWEGWRDARAIIRNRLQTY